MFCKIQKANITLPRDAIIGVNLTKGGPLTIQGAELRQAVSGKVGSIEYL
jgi:hypothetical protein